MIKLHYKIERASIRACHDAAYLSRDELDSDPAYVRLQLSDAVTQTLSTDIYVTISGVTMFLAAWEDPEHWAEDWARVLKLDDDADVSEAVSELLGRGMESDA